MRYLVCIILVFALISLAFSQTFTSYIFSPIQGAPESIPYTEIDFQSIRMHGFGFQLHNVVKDSVTDLFRNPAMLYNLDKGLVLLNYERAQIFYYKLSRRLGYLSPSVIGRLPIGSYPSNSYLTAGYWSPNFLSMKIPAGIFFRGASSKYNFDGSSNYPVFDPFADDRFLETNEEIEIKDLFGKAWLGLLNKPHFKLALSYSFNYLNAMAMGLRSYERFTPYGRGQRYFYYDRNGYENDLQWYRHQFSIGSHFFSGGWSIEPAVSFLMFSNNEMLREYSDFKSYEYEESSPDSILYGNFDYLDGNSSIQRDLTGAEVNFQANKGKTVIFASGLYAGISPEEKTSQHIRDLSISYYDTSQYSHSSSKFSFDDNGNLLRLRGGFGRRYSLKNMVDLYGAFIIEFDRHELSGLLLGAGSQTRYNYDIDTTQIDSIYRNPLDYTSRQLRLILPIGLKMKWKMLALRFGLVWYYWDQSEELDLEDNSGKDVFHSEQAGNQSFRDEYFGFGLKWKKLEMNVASNSDLLNINSWDVGIRYYFD